MFSRLSSLVIDDVVEQEGVIVARARAASWPGPFPGRGALTGPVHGLVGDGLLCAVLELGFAEPLQVQARSRGRVRIPSARAPPRRAQTA